LRLHAKGINMRKVTLEQYLAEGESLYGPNRYKWKFRCPSCGHVAAAEDWRAAGAPENAVAFSCVGRWLPKSEEMLSKAGGPCNYAGGGLFKLNPVIVTDGEKEHSFFEFADDASLKREVA
jgi:hypothetical protein